MQGTLQKNIGLQSKAGEEEGYIRQPHRSVMGFEVEVQFYLLFAMLFGVEVNFYTLFTMVLEVEVQFYT